MENRRWPLAGKWLRGNALRAKWLKGNGLRPRGWCGAGEIETEIEIEWIGGEAAKGTQPPLFRGEGDRLRWQGNWSHSSEHNLKERSDAQIVVSR